MPRSVKKGAWVDKGIQKVVERIRAGSQRPQVIRTWSRRSTITPDMVGHKLGEFSPTRVFKGHSGTKAEKAEKTAKVTGPSSAPSAPAAPAA